jgi:hypothetical protein
MSHDCRESEDDFGDGKSPPQGGFPPDDLKAQLVWGVVSTWAVDVYYDLMTYDEAMEFAKGECRKEGQHAVVVLAVASFNGPPLPRAKAREPS